MEQKDAENEFTYDVPYKNFNVSNVFEWGRKNPDMSKKRVYIDTNRNEYFMEMFDHPNKYNYCHG